MTLDLTKITTPFGLLDSDTQDEMRDAYADDKPIESYGGKEGWYDVLRPVWSMHLTYRVKPEPMRDIDIPWDALSPNWIAAARDEDGMVFVYDAEPFVLTSDARCWTSRGPNGAKSFLPISDLLTHDPGNKPWDQSLVFRPGYDAPKGAK